MKYSKQHLARIKNVNKNKSYGYGKNKFTKSKI